MRYLKKAASGTAIAVLALALPSACVNEEYDLTNVDTTVSFGGDALVFPLGSTEQLKLKTLLSEEDYKYITSLNGKELGFSLNDSKQFDEFPDLTSGLDIEPVTITKNVPIDFGNIDLNDITIDGEELDYDVTFDGMDVPQDEIDVPRTSSSVSTGIYDEYNLDRSQMRLPLEDRVMSFPGLYNPEELLGGMPEIPDEYLQNVDIPAMPLDRSTFNVNVELMLPEGIFGVSDISLDPNARIEVTVALENSFLTSGSVIPDISLDLSQFIRVAGETGPLHLGQDFALDAVNSTVSKTYGIEELVYSQNDWGWTDEGYAFNKNAEVSADGSISFSGISTTMDAIRESAADGGLGLDVTVAFRDVVVDDIAMTVGGDRGGFEQNVQEDGIEVVMDPISLPEEVTGISDITFTDGSDGTRPSVLRLTVASENLVQMKDLDVVLNDVRIVFPDFIEFGQSDDPEITYEGGNVVRISEIDIKGGDIIELPVKSVRPDAPVDGVVNMAGTVSVDASLSAGGTLRLSELPLDSGSDPKVTFDVDGYLMIDDYSLEVSSVRHTIEPQSKTFTVDLPAEVGNIGTILIEPEGNPALTVDVTVPEVRDFDIRANGLKIVFPDMLVFDNPGYNYDPEDNSINFNESDEIPENIELAIAQVEVTPRTDDGNSYYAEGTILFSGEVIVNAPSGQVGKSDVDALVADGIGIRARVPQINVKSAKFSRFEASVETQETFKVFDYSELPEELVKIDMVELTNTMLDLSVNAENMPYLGENKQPQISVDVTLPEELVVDDDRVTDHIFHIEGPLVENDGVYSYEMEPLQIVGVNLADVDLESEGDFSVTIDVVGTVFVDEPSIAAEDLTGQGIDVTLDGSIASYGEDGAQSAALVIGRVTGNVDYQFDPSDLNQSIALDELPDFVQNADINLDFANPYIKLQVKSNVGIPVKGTLEIIPEYEDGSSAQPLTLSMEIPAAESAAEEKTTLFWISDSQDGVPSDYTWLQAGIRQLLTRIPKKIDLNISAGTDPEITAVVEPYAEYRIDMAYDVVVPFVFGPDTDIRMDYTMPLEDTDGLLGELLEMNSLGLSGTVDSTIPLALDLDLELLDSHENVIATEPMNLKIAAGNDENPSRSEFDVVLKLAEGADGADFSSIRMNFKVTSRDMPDFPITEDSFIKVTLKARVPGGITLDLSALGESENGDFTDGTEN